MPTFRYCPRYQFNGPSLTNPLLDELSEDEVQRNRRLLVDDLENHFHEIGCVVEASQAGIVSITGEISRHDCDDIVAGYLRNLHLVAVRITA